MFIKLMQKWNLQDHWLTRRDEKWAISPAESVALGISLGLILLCLVK